MNIIIPCAGKSSRFPGLRPKWMLTHPNGNMMVVEAVKGLSLKGHDVHVVILQEHEDTYNIAQGLKKNFLKIGVQVNVIILKESTKSQSETVYKAIKQAELKGAMLIKDSDNYFKLPIENYKFNFIGVDCLANHTSINAKNKSYVDSHKDSITDIAEKEVISENFCVGAYYFKSIYNFCQIYKEMHEEPVCKDSPPHFTGELYISQMIKYMLIEYGEVFITFFVQDYKDWGTLEDWLKYKRSIKSYFVDIDGVLVENGAEYFGPVWGDTPGIQGNIDVINKLHSAGNQIILATARKEKFRKVTELQLKRCGILYDKLVMDMLSTQRILINDFSTSNPYPSAKAININRNSAELNKYIGDN